MWTTSTILVEYYDINYPKYFIKKLYSNDLVIKLKKDYFKENPFDLPEKEKENIWNWFKEYFIDIIDFKYLKILSKFLNSNDFCKQLENELIFWISCVSDRVMADLTVNLIFETSKKDDKKIEKEKIYEYMDKLTNLEKKELDNAVDNYIELLGITNIVDYNNHSIEAKTFYPSIEVFAFAIFYLFDQKQIPINILRSYKFKYILLDINEVLDYIRKLQDVGLVNFMVKKETFNLEPKIGIDKLLYFLHENYYS
ncbi:MAG: hypothetical protein R6U52_06525 [Kosmotogaceae bacterium]